MKSTGTGSGLTCDKQLAGIDLEAVMEKRRLDQAMNAKEFAVAAGVSYSTAREWFHLPGFPAFEGVVFWHDFVQWRAGRYGVQSPSDERRTSNAAVAASKMPPRAAQILLES